MADQAAQALHGRRALTVTLIVVSGAPGTGHGRHPIHRDVISPAMAGRPASLAATVTPLRLGADLIEVDTGAPGAAGTAVTAVRSVLSL